MSDSTECSFSLVVAILASRLSSKSDFFLVSLYVYPNKTAGGVVCLFMIFLSGLCSVLKNEISLSFV